MNKTLSSLIGGALGDALGYSREFSKIGQLDPAWQWATFENAPSKKHFLDRHGKVYISDDTQMTIATGRALIESQPFRTQTFAQTFAHELSRAYVAWSQHPDNFRAPGAACMRACTNMAKGLSWQDATDINTMGCGANMRVAPIALYTDPSANDPIELAYLSAAITHAHPAALASAALTVQAIMAAHDGMIGTEILDHLIEECLRKWDYPHDVLGDLWEQSEYGSPTGYLRMGYAECLPYLESARDALDRGWKGQVDPCRITGEAWIAPEALAGAILCVAGLWDNPVQVLQRAAVSNGDSDSLAAIAGNIIGASGVDWPEDWVNQLETGPVLELRKLAETL